MVQVEADTYLIGLFEGIACKGKQPLTWPKSMRQKEYVQVRVPPQGRLKPRVTLVQIMFHISSTLKHKLISEKTLFGCVLFDSFVRSVLRKPQRNIVCAVSCSFSIVFS